MLGQRVTIAFVIIFAVLCQSIAARAATLNIVPVVQQTPEWCWLATGEMIFRYYNIPANNANFQCGEARFQGAVQVAPTGPMAFNGPCWMNCVPCAGVGAGSVQGLVNMIVQYPYGMSIVTGQTYRLQTPKVSLQPMQPAAVKAEIDAGRPIIAGISPGEGMQPLGIAQHAVLMVGYDNNGATLIINDPFFYQQAGMTPPYVQVGGAQLELGRFSVPFNAMIGRINWNNAVYGIGP
jgi:hypothetical protein